MKQLTKKIESIRFIQIIVVILTITAGIMGSAAGVGAGDAVEDNLTEYLNYVEEYRGFSGAVLITRGGRIIYSSRESGVFPIASLTKQFTAAAVMKLAEQGLLSPAERVVNYLPDFPHSTEITIKQLLNHTSGLDTLASLQEYREEAGELRLLFKPGEGWGYSDAGYYLLGRIIEQISGLSYDEYLQKEFFQPLGMEQTGMYSGSEDFQGLPGRETVDGFYLESADSAGGLYSTAVDLHIWLTALETGRVIKKAALEEMFSSSVEFTEGGYAYGWFTGRDRGGRERVFHSGSLPNYSSLIMLYPEKGVRIIILSDRRMNIISQGNVLAAVLFDGYTLPAAVEAAADSHHYEQYTGVYRFAPGYNIEISRSGSRFYARTTGHERLEIFPEKTRDRFFYQALDVELEFTRGENGEISGLLYRIIGGEELSASRLTGQ